MNVTLSPLMNMIPPKPWLKGSWAELSYLRNSCKEKVIANFQCLKLEYTTHFPNVIYAYQSPETCEFREMKLILECTDRCLGEHMCCVFSFRIGSVVAYTLIPRMSQLLVKYGWHHCWHLRKGLQKTYSLSSLHAS